MSATNGVQPQSNVRALARVEVPGAIEPQTMGELERLAAHASKTGFFGAKSQEQALLVMMAGRDLGLSYSQALRAFHVIEGKPTLSADGMVATCLVRRDVCEYFRTVEVDDKRATVETTRVGQEPQRYTFTMQDAQRAGVTSKPTWGRYPSRMLLARARAALARDVYPDLLLGLYDPDEIEPVPSPAPQRTSFEVAPAADSAPAHDAETVDELATFRAEMGRIARDGTEEDAKSIMAAVAKSSLSREQRTALRNDAQSMLEQVRARVAANKEVNREPGSDDQ